MNAAKPKKGYVKALVTVFVCIALVLLIIRIWQVNQKVDMPKIKNYQMGEAVPLGKDYFNMKYESCDGYYVRIDRAELLSYQDYLAKYGYKEEGKELIPREIQTFPDMVYDIEMTVENKNKTDRDSGIDVWNYWLCASDFSLQIQQELYEMANPGLEEGTTAFRLRPESKKVFHLPYGIPLHSNSAFLTPKALQQRELDLVVSLYPVQKQIRISPSDL